MNQPRSLLLSSALLIVFAALSRLLPHYPNFTAVGAIAVFGGAVIKDKKWALLLPLAALFLSDVCLHLFTSTPGFYGGEQAFVYGGFILVTLLSFLIKKATVANITLAAVWSGLVFFIVSNLGIWLLGSFYTKDVTGLIACFTAALPFYKNEFFGNFVLNSIYGNLFFSAILFGSYYAIKKKVAADNSVYA